MNPYLFASPRSAKKKRAKKEESVKKVVLVGTPASPSIYSQTTSLRSQLSIPPPTPLPNEDLEDFDASISEACNNLQNDFTSGARQLADASLKHLAYVTDIAACSATSWGEYWAMIVHTAKQLSQARPSMSAAITACQLRALAQIARRWNEEQANGCTSTSDFARIAGGTLDAVVSERSSVGDKLGDCFTDWIKEKFGTRETNAAVQILTLSNSSTIRNAILHALRALPDLKLHLTILESRPRCEGADMAAQILTATEHQDRLSIRLVPDCVVATVGKDMDIVLLGADRISSTGAVSNKIGSLAAAICAKQMSKNVVVATISDGDKIAALGFEEKHAELHPVHELSSGWAPDTRCRLLGRENVEVFGEWFEWVPAEFVDVYVTEMGVLGTKEVEGLAREIGELEEYIF